jgi:hypothetical protein
MTFHHNKSYPPEPLRSHKYRSLAIKVGTGLVFGHIGLLIIVALYYIILETSTFNWLTHLGGFNGSTKAWWHATVPNSDERHLIRSVGEGFLGGMLFATVTWNHYKKRNQKKRNLLDKIEIKLRIPNPKDTRRLNGFQYAATLPLAVLYAIPGWELGQFVANKITHAINYVAPYVNSHSPYFEKVAAVWTSDAPHIAVGLFGSYFLGKRVLRKAYDDIQLTLVDRRVALNKPLRFYHRLAPTFEARYNDRLQTSYDVREQYQLEHPGRFPVIPTFLSVGMVAGLALAGYGYYVLTVIAVPH